MADWTFAREKVWRVDGELRSDLGASGQRGLIEPFVNSCRCFSVFFILTILFLCQLLRVDAGWLPSERQELEWCCTFGFSWKFKVFS